VGVGDSAGGSLQLVEILDSHGTALYSDLRRYWSVDLRGLFSHPPTVSPEEVLWLYEQLPDNAATRRSPNGEQGHWELGTMLQAMTVNAIQANTYTYIVAHSKKPPKPPPNILPPALDKKPAPRPTVVAVSQIPDIGGGE
jgi:hypothetical protein